MIPDIYNKQKWSIHVHRLGSKITETRDKNLCFQARTEYNSSGYTPTRWLLTFQKLATGLTTSKNQKQEHYVNVYCDPDLHEKHFKHTSTFSHSNSLTRQNFNNQHPVDILHIFIFVSGIQNCAVSK